MGPPRDGAFPHSFNANLGRGSVACFAFGGRFYALGGIQVKAALPLSTWTSFAKVGKGLSLEPEEGGPTREIILEGAPFAFSEGVAALGPKLP